MEIREIRAMSDEELLNALEDQRESLFRLRFRKAAGQLEDPNQIQRTRHDIARLNTVLTERRKAAQAGEGEKK